FTSITNNKLIGFPDGNVINWCPTMDLLTISMNRMSIWVFRLNGERIYSINNKSPIIEFDWSPNGKFFCVSGIDKLIKIYDSNNGKFIHSIKSDLNLPIGLINWDKIIFEKFEAFELGEINTLNYLPKLQFDDNLIENQLDLLILISSNSIMSLTFNNLFTIDDLILPESYKYIDHKTSNDLFNQYFLVENEGNQLCLINFFVNIPSRFNHSLDDEIEPNTNPHLKKYLIDIIGYITQLIAIQNHVFDQLNYLQSECKPYISHFDRNLSNLKDSVYSSVDLTTNFPTQKELETKILNVLYDILLTNLIPSDLKDYWLNQLGERGLKKHNKLVNTLYDLIRKVVFTQIITGIEKMIVILNNLEGLVNWFEHNSSNVNSLSQAPHIDISYFGLNLNSILKLIENCQSFIKLLYKLIWDINDEQKHINDFLAWCKIEIIDKLASEDNDIETFFNNNQTQPYKNSSILNYLNNFLFEPRIFKYFNIDCSMNEVLLLSENSKENLLSNFENLQNNLKNGILINFSQFFKSIIKFNNPVNLDAASTDAKLISRDENNLLITNIENASLSLIQYNIQENIKEKRIININHEVISYDWVDSDRIILLYKNDSESILDLFSINLLTNDIVDLNSIDIEKSLKFNQDSYVSTPKYLAVNGKRSIGCVLDSSKQKYVVFK
ncbi:hypothetical protein HYPBUDRAFT_97707, partial [Hyphopichia burtonii NRRL Y-1933]